MNKIRHGDRVMEKSSRKVGKVMGKGTWRKPNGIRKFYTIRFSDGTKNLMRSQIMKVS